jgi:hypothetical protein
MKIKKPCSPNGYHDMRITFQEHFHHAEDSEVIGLGRLYVSWDEIRMHEQCRSCKLERTIARRENYRQRHVPPPT